MKDPDRIEGIREALAVAYLMNRKPDHALAILQGTRIADLSNDLRDQRAEFQDIAKKIASVDTLDGFLRDLRTRYLESSAVSPGGTTGEGASASPPLDAAAKNSSATSGAGSSPPKPAAAPPDKEPTGSIPRMPKMRARPR